MVKTLINVQTRRIFLKTLLILVLLISFQVFFESGFAYSKEKPKSSESIRLLEQGNMAYDHFMYSVAAKNYEAYLRVTGQEDDNVLIKLSDSYWRMREYDNARKVLVRLSSNQSIKLSAQQRIRLSELEARMENYSQAALWLHGIAGYESKATGYLDPLAIEGFKEDSVDWHISYLNINTGFREFSPLLAGDKLIFSSNGPALKREKASGWDGKSYARLWTVPLSQLSGTTQFSAIQVNDSIPEEIVKSKRFSPVYEGSDTKSISLRGIITGQVQHTGIDSLRIVKLLDGLRNLKFNVATASLDSNNNLYFSSNQLEKGINIPNRIKLMKSRYENGSVTELQAVSLGDSSQYSVMHPALNKSGTLLVFSSDKSGGKGGFDLYYTKKMSANLPWNVPEAFSQLINTPGNEVFPYQSPDGFLYFSSDAMAGLGGLDIYRILLEDALNGVGEAEHIGYPINSSSDDFGWVQDSTFTGYFTSDRIFGNDNIYRFEYKPQPKISQIAGIVREEKTQRPMKEATVFLYNKTTNEVFVEKTDETGKYVFDVKNTGDFVVKAIETNCKDDCISINIEAKKTRNVTFDVPKELLLEMTYKNSWVLDNVLYDYNKWQIRPDAKPSLDSLISILKKYPIQVELGSYTDSRGKAKYNYRLSQLRAESTVRYVVNHGIDAGRIKAKGYGESHLLNRCSDGVNCSEEEHQLNRRTEITVIYNPAPINSIDPTPYSKGQKLNLHDLPENFFIDCE